MCVEMLRFISAKNVLKIFYDDMTGMKYFSLKIESLFANIIY